MDQTIRKKILGIFILFVLLFLLVIIKAFYVQIVNRGKLIEYAKSQFMREVEVYPNRGNIFDRNESPLAINVQTYSIFTIPKYNKDGMETYKQLSQIVPELNFKEIKEDVITRKRYTWLARKIPLKEDQVEQIKKLSGVFIEAIPKRIYPNHELMSHVLGFVGLDNKGLAGVEFMFDNELRGKPRIVKYLKDAKGRPVQFESQHIGERAHDINLTIDKDVQSIAEIALKEAIVNHNAEGGAVGVMSAKTGEILALANYPNFDPNEVGASKDTHRKLSFISAPTEPGSIFKTFTIASALEHKVSKPDTNYYCEKGSFRVQDHIISEAESDHKFEWLSVAQILQESSNIGTTKIAFDLSFPKFRESLIKFGIGEKTGIELPGESRGIFTDKQNIQPLSLSNMSFGQGIATTGPQILSFYAAIANGGIKVKPTIIKKESVIKKEEELEKDRIMSKETARELAKMLTMAVEKGTGSNAMISYFKIAGKTGTAQRVNSSGGYSGYIPSFVGFPTNVENPFVIYAYVDNPRSNGYYGNAVAAPIFKKVAQYMLFKNKDYNQLAIEKDKIKSGNQLTVSTPVKSREYGGGRVPDFIGLDKASSIRLAEKLGIRIIQKGMGIVSSQIPSPGAPVESENPVRLIFSAPKYE